MAIAETGQWTLLMKNVTMETPQATMDVPIIAKQSQSPSVETAHKKLAKNVTTETHMGPTPIETQEIGTIHAGNALKPTVATHTSKHQTATDKQKNVTMETPQATMDVPVLAKQNQQLL